MGMMGTVQKHNCHIELADALCRDKLFHPTVHFTVFDPTQVSIQGGHWWDLHQRLCVCV